jgi:hypothetical protein
MIGPQLTGSPAGEELAFLPPNTTDSAKFFRRARGTGSTADPSVVFRSVDCRFESHGAPYPSTSSQFIQVSSQPADLSALGPGRRRSVGRMSDPLAVMMATASYLMTA